MNPSIPTFEIPKSIVKPEIIKFPVQPVPTTTHESTEIERKPTESDPFAALAFKIATDPYVGRLCFIRAYSGVSAVEAGSIDAAIDTALHMQPLTVSGWTDLWLAREQELA